MHYSDGAPGFWVRNRHRITLDRCLFDRKQTSVTIMAENKMLCEMESVRHFCDRLQFQCLKYVIDFTPADELFQMVTFRVYL